jgi:CBS domain-containing protein
MSTRNSALAPLAPGMRVPTGPLQFPSFRKNHRSQREGSSQQSLLQVDSVEVPNSSPSVRRPCNDQRTIGPATASWRDGLTSRATARDLMTACSATLRPEDSIERAARLMSETRTGSVPVVDGAGRLVGIITDRDITVRLIALGTSIPHAQVSDCMTREAFACSAECSFESCVSAMSWHQLRRMPIVDDEHRVIGTISQHDLAAYVCEHPERARHGSMTDILWALAF